MYSCVQLISCQIPVVMSVLSLQQMDGSHHGLGGVRAVEAVDSKDFQFAADPVQPLSMVGSHVMVLGQTLASVIANTVRVKYGCFAQLKAKQNKKQQA